MSLASGKSPAFRRTSLIHLILLFSLATFLLSPVLSTGYLDDDAINSNISGIAGYENTTLPRVALQWMVGVPKLFSRMVPGSGLLLVCVFGVLRTLFLYKIYLIASVLLSLFLFYRWMMRLDFGEECSGLSLVFFLPLIQMRKYYDAFLAFQGLLPFILCMTLLSLHCFDRFLQSGRRLWFLLSLAPYFIGSLTYEIMYIFFPLHLIAALARGKSARNAVKVMLPFLGITVVLIISSVVMRLINPSAPLANLSKYQIDMDVSRYLPTLAKQLLGALPLTQYVFNPKHGLPEPASLLMNRGDFLRLTLMFLFTAVLSYAAIRSVAFSEKRHVTPLKWFFALAVPLWVLPALMMASSPYFQRDIVLGVAYLPVYIEYFGVALLMACGVIVVLPRIRPSFLRHAGVIVLAIAIAAVTGLTDRINRMVCGSFSLWTVPRQSQELALANGLLQSVPDNSVIVSPDFPWDNPVFYYLHCGKRFRIARPIGRTRIDFVERVLEIPMEVPVEVPYFRLQYERKAGFQWWILMRIEKSRVNSTTGLTEEGIQEALLFADFNGRLNGTMTFPQIRGKYYDGSSSFITNREELTLAKQAPDWALYRLKMPQLVFSSLRVSLISEDAALH